MPDEVLISVEEAARRLNAGRSTTYKLVLGGELPSIKVGKLRRVVVAGLDEYVARKLQEAVPA